MHEYCLYNSLTSLSLSNKFIHLIIIIKAMHEDKIYIHYEIKDYRGHYEQYEKIIMLI